MRNLFFATMAALVSSCGGGGGGSNDIATSDANALMEAIGAKIGNTEMTLQSGPLPTPSPEENAPKLLPGVDEVLAEPGDTVSVPLSVQTTSLLTKLCLKIGIANSTLCANLATAPATSLSAVAKIAAGKPRPKQLSQTDQTLLLSVDVPENVRPGGTFCMDLVAEDQEGLVSNLAQVCVDVRADLPDAAQVPNDQPDANELPALLAQGEWVGSCLALPEGSDESASALKFVLQFDLNTAYTVLGEFWSDAACEEEVNELRPVLTGTYAAGEAQFNRQLQLWQRPFDFLPQTDPVSGLPFEPCFNVLNIEDDQLLLGVPQGVATFADQPEVPGSCVSAATRPPSVTPEMPYARRARSIAENQPPVADAGADQSVTAGQSVTLQGGASDDPDGQITAFLWEPVNSSVVLQNAQTATASFTAPSTPGVYSFRLTVTDDRGATAQDLIDVNVNAFVEPRVNAGDDRSVASGNSVQLAGTAVGTGLTSTVWQQIDGGAPVTLQGANTLTPSFVAPQQTSGVRLLRFRLTANYANGGTLADEVAVEVAPVLLSGGALRFTLTWNSDANLDLYVAEPSGALIFHDVACEVQPTPTQPASQCQPSSDGGVQDLADADGFGPENIVYASTPPDGQYCFGVRYFDNSPTSAPSPYVLRVRVDGAENHVESGTLQAPGAAAGFVLTKSGTSYTYRAATPNDVNICPDLLLQ